MGLYWKRATNLGGMLAVLAGLVVWMGCEFFYREALVPPQLAGLLAAFGGMVAGSLALRSQQREATT
jgi:SSS family solute:Na+ symporter